MNYAEFCKEYGDLKYDVFIFALYKIALRDISDEEFKRIIEETKQEKREYKDGLKVADKLTENQKIINKEKPTPPPPKVVWR
jgi:hypothetical protein